MNATYSKLKSGDWGIRVEGKAKEGLSITVKKRDGSTKTEQIQKVLWTDGKVSLCAIVKSDAPSRGAGKDVCAECGRPGYLVYDLEDGLMKHRRCCDIAP